MKPVFGIFLRKEWRDLRGSSQVLPGYLLLPAIGVILPAIMLSVFPLDPSATIRDPDVIAILRFAARDPGLLAYPEVERMPRLLVRELGVFFLLMPVILSSMSAALAIAGERAQHTLEPILATPVSDRELLLAKLLAALVPAVLVTWVAAALHAVVTGVVTHIRLGQAIVPQPAFLVSMLVVAPLGGAAAALIGMRASIRARDIYAAVQTAGLWVIPAGMVLIGLVGRPAVRSPLLALASAVLLAVLAWFLFRGNLRRLDREEILTRAN